MMETKLTRRVNVECPLVGRGKHVACKNSRQPLPPEAAARIASVAEEESIARVSSVLVSPIITDQNGINVEETQAE